MVASRGVDQPVDTSSARRFLAQWLANRRLQLADNAGGTREGSAEASDQNRKLFSVPAYTSVEEMNRLHGGLIGRLSSGSMNNGLSPQIQKRISGFQQAVLDSANQSIDAGAYGTYSTNGAGRLAVAIDNPDGHQSVMVHELAHAMEARPQESKISEIMKGAKINGGADAYLESPTEIHSRLMQIRHDLKLDPRKNYNMDDLRKMKGSSDNKFRIFDRYDDNTVLRLLNEVASVNNMDSSGMNA